LGAAALGQSATESVPEALRAEPPVMQPNTGVGNLDPSGDIELIAAERDDTHRYAAAERLHRYSVTAVTNDAGRPLEDRPVR
jgi:hypothetical protein